MNNKQFGEWFKEQWYSDKWEQLRESGIAPAEFENLPFAFKWGVYLEFFDSVDKKASIRMLKYVIYYMEQENWDISIPQKEAVKKEFEILEA